MFTHPRQGRACWVLIRFIKFILVFALIYASSLNGLVVVAQTTNVDSVTFPSAQVAFIIGPQLRMGTSQNPNPWFDTTQLSRGAVHGASFPAIPPITLNGTLSVNNGSATVFGVGTRFLSEVDPNGPAPYFNGRLQIRESNGTTYQQVQVLRVDSDTQMTLTAPYPFTSQSGAQGNTGYYDGVNYNNDVYMNANYYDLGVALYALYYRTGDVTYLNYARKVADSWWLSPSINGGANMQRDSFVDDLDYSGCCLRVFQLSQRQRSATAELHTLVEELRILAFIDLCRLSCSDCDFDKRFTCKWNGSASS